MLETAQPAELGATDMDIDMDVSAVGDATTDSVAQAQRGCATPDTAAMTAPFKSSRASAAASERAAGAGVSELADRALLRRLIRTAFRTSTGPATRLRRLAALWLTGSPEPHIAPHGALLTSLSAYMRSGEPAQLWLNPEHDWPKLKPFLLELWSLGVFVVHGPPRFRADVVLLDTAALRRAAAAATAAASVGPGAFAGAGPGIADVFPADADVDTDTAVALQPLVDTVFPPAAAADPATHLRSLAALWLAGSPEPTVGPCSALLTSLSAYMRSGEPAQLWLSPEHSWPKLKAFLLEPESLEVFTVAVPPGRKAEAVALDVTALRRAAAAAAAAGTVVVPTTAAAHTGGPAAASTPAVVVRAGLSDAPAPAPRAGDGSERPTAAAPLPKHIAARLAGPEAEVPTAARVAAAAAAAWPGGSPLARLKRRAAVLLAAVEGPGPEGHPHSMLTARIGDLLCKDEREALAELQSAGARRPLRQLLNEGDDEGHSGGGGGNGGGIPPLLRVVEGRYDGIVVLDLAQLLRQYGAARTRVGGAVRAAAHSQRDYATASAAAAGVGAGAGIGPAATLPCGDIPLVPRPLSPSSGSAATRAVARVTTAGYTRPGVALNAASPPPSAPPPPPPPPGSPPFSSFGAGSTAAAGSEEVEQQLALAVERAARRLWPGQDAVSVIRRCAAKQLALQRDGPDGPGSMLWAQATAFLYTTSLPAVARLLRDGPPGDSKSAALRRALHGAGGADAAAVATNNGGAAAAGIAADGVDGVALMHVLQRPGLSDSILKLDVRGLLEAGGQQGAAALLRRWRQQHLLQDPRSPDAGRHVMAQAASGSRVQAGGTVGPVASAGEGQKAAADTPQSLSSDPRVGDCRRRIDLALLRRFPTNDDPAVVRRCVARLLAKSPPPHELAFATLGSRVPQLLPAGAARVRHNLRALCAEEPGVFTVALQGKSRWVVRLACPALLRLAAAHSEATAAAATTAVTAAAAAMVDAAAPVVPVAAVASPATSSEGTVPSGAGRRFGPTAATHGSAAGSSSAGSTPAGLTATPMQVPVPIPVTVGPAAAGPSIYDGAAQLTVTPVRAAAVGVAAASAAASRYGVDLDSLLRVSSGDGSHDAWNRSMLSTVAVYVITDPYGPDLAAALQHCHVTPHVGLSVHSYGRRPAVISLYAPQAAASAETEAAAAAGAESAASAPDAAADGQLAWPAAVYVLDCTACEERYGGRGTAAGIAAAAALVGRLAPLLTDVNVDKVAHGCEQVHCLEEALAGSSTGGGDSREGGGGSCVCPMMDTRVLLRGITHMLGLPGDPPEAALDVSVSSPTDAFRQGAAALQEHVCVMQEALSRIGLWSDRPWLLAALTHRHFAALREEMWSAVATGMAQAARVAEGKVLPAPAAAAATAPWDVAARPLSESAVAAAASGSAYLPELWTAMLQEAVPWVAVHAPLGIMQRRRGRLAAEAAD